MHRLTRLPALLLALALGLAAASPADAQLATTFSVAGMLGAGGSLDADPGDDLGNESLQLNVSFLTAPKTFVAVRAGQLDLDQPGGFGQLFGAEMTYATIAGEYRYNYGFYESGLYAGLGAYQLDGTSILTGQSADESSVGVVLGLTGEFQLTRRWGILVEIAGHYVDFDDANLFVTAHAGVAFHF